MPAKLGHYLILPALASLVLVNYTLAVQLRVLQMDEARIPARELFALAASRALALFFGGFSLLNLAGGLWRANFDANLLWIDLRVLPQFPAQTLLLLSSLCLVAFAVRPPRSTWRRVLTIGCVGLLAAAAPWNTLEFYALLARHEIRTIVPVPLSLLLSAALLLILWMAARPVPMPRHAKVTRWAAVMLAVCLAGFPIAQMVCFGNTDYRRPADVAVVFGARTYADGHPSDALADRVRTACQLYRDGEVRKLVFSGGPGDGAVTEPEAMRRMALKLGVKPEDILTDDAGLNTRATVRNTEPMFARLNARRVLVVSHFYHLPRIKLAYEQAGWDVQTVPARQGYILRQIPYSMAREVPAIWVYYLRPLVS